MYSYGLKVGAQLLTHGDLNQAARRLLVPVNFWRAVEFDLVLKEARFQPTDRVLDIGSPKLISLYIAKKLGAEVYATDIDEYFVKTYTDLGAWEGLPRERFHVGVEDGRHLSFADASFDKVFSISVIEHIPATGDSECVREIARVLKPGGLCLITVPFWPTSRELYSTPEGFYWAKEAVVGATTAEGRVFWERRYSEEDLYQRLIIPSGLRVRAVRYVGEKVLAGSDKEFSDYLPGPVSAVTGHIQPLLARALLTPPADDWRTLKKPLCAFLALEKPVTSMQSAPSEASDA
jgi:SAM-dependent methyltransferase